MLHLWRSLGSLFARGGHLVELFIQLVKLENDIEVVLGSLHLARDEVEPMLEILEDASELDLDIPVDLLQVALDELVNERCFLIARQFA